MPAGDHGSRTRVVRYGRKLVWLDPAAALTTRPTGPDVVAAGTPLLAAVGLVGEGSDL
jgi:hypothetical protein